MPELGVACDLRRALGASDVAQRRNRERRIALVERGFKIRCGVCFDVKAHWWPVEFDDVAFRAAAT